MTAEQAIKREILLTVFAWRKEKPPVITVDNVDSIYEEKRENCEGDLQDARNQFRSSGQEANLECEEFSRHYECEQVATQLSDLSWVSWTYWHGGGKHAEPQAIEWMSSAFFVDCKEEQKVVTVRTFSKKQ